MLFYWSSSKPDMAVTLLLRRKKFYLHPLRCIYYFDAFSSNMGVHTPKAVIFLAHRPLKTLHSLKIPTKKSPSKTVFLSIIFPPPQGIIFALAARYSSIYLKYLGKLVSS